MKTWKGLFPRLHERAAIESAARFTAAGKRRRPDVAWFLFRFESETRRISEALADGSWRPSGFDVHVIHEPKARAIARAPFEDRVVHSALVRVLEPLYAPSLVPGDFACRGGFGTERAILELMRMIRCFRFVLHLDIRAYFPSLDPVMVHDLVAGRVRDPPFLEVLSLILKSGAGLLDRCGIRSALGLGPDWPPPGVGLPIGAHTSQFLASHVVLLELDHRIKRELKVPGYVRYVDDLFLFGETRAELRTCRAAIAEWLWRERRLRLKHPSAPILPCHGHLDALGFRVRRQGALALPRAERRLRERIRVAVHAESLMKARFKGSISSSTHLLLGLGAAGTTRSSREPLRT